MGTQSVNLALSLGDSAPDVSLPATDGRMYSLASFRDQDCVVVVFLANHCPYVGSWEDRLIALAREYSKRSVSFVAISSSDTATFPADSFDQMRERAEANEYPFPYLYDEGVRHEVAPLTGSVKKKGGVLPFPRLVSESVPAPAGVTGNGGV